MASLQRTSGDKLVSERLSEHPIWGEFEPKREFSDVCDVLAERADSSAAPLIHRYGKILAEFARLELGRGDAESHIRELNDAIIKSLSNTQSNARLVRLIALWVQSWGFLAASLELYRFATEVGALSFDTDFPGAPLIRTAARSFWASDVTVAADLVQPLRRMAATSSAPDLWRLADYFALWAIGREARRPFLRRTGNREFYKLITGRTAWVHGPGPRESMSSGETGDADVNAVTLSSGTEGAGVFSQGFDATSRGMIVGYINRQYGEWLVGLHEARRKELLRSLSYISMKKSVYRQIDADQLGIPSRVFCRAPKVLLPSPNMAPAMVFDLLASGASRIQLSGVTFFVGGYATSGYSLDLQSGSPSPHWRDPLRSLLLHDPLANRQFVRNLYFAERVSADPGGARVLEASENEYLRSLELTYVPTTYL